MSQKARSKWLDLSVEIINHNDVSCPICNRHSVKHIYIGDSVTKIGYLQVWCTECAKGIRISRVKIPENEYFIDFNDSDSIRSIPFFEEITG